MTTRKAKTAAKAPRTAAKASKRRDATEVSDQYRIAPPAGCLSCGAEETNFITIEATAKMAVAYRCCTICKVAGIAEAEAERRWGTTAAAITERKEL